MFYDKMHKDELYDLYVIEAYQDNSIYRVNKNCHNITSIKSTQIFWQKEQLLNIGLNKIKNKYDFVGWVDADIVPVNPNWFDKLKSTLNENKIVQICSTMKKHKNHFGDYALDCSMSYFISRNEHSLYDILLYRKGEPGYGYIYPSKLFKDTNKPLYDKAVFGSGDFLNFIGYLEFKEFTQFISDDRFFKELDEFKKDFIKWRHTTKKVASIEPLSVEFEIGYHGNFINRQYSSREHLLRASKYNPSCDLEETKTLYKIKNQKLLELLRNYFYSRKEDDHLQNSLENYHFKNKILVLIRKYYREFSINDNSFDFVNKLQNIKPKSKTELTKKNGEFSVCGVRFFNKSFNLNKIKCETHLYNNIKKEKHYNYGKFYLNYIIENYENLPDVVFFLNELVYKKYFDQVNYLTNETNSLNDECKYTPFEKIRNTIKLNLHKHITRKNEIKFSNYSFDTWQKRYIGNHTIEYKKTTDGYNIWNHSSKPVDYDPKQCFYVGKNVILKNPLKKYKSLLASVSNNNGKCEEAIYLLYSWQLLLS